MYQQETTISDDDEEKREESAWKVIYASLNNEGNPRFSIIITIMYNFKVLSLKLFTVNESSIYQT